MRITLSGSQLSMLSAMNKIIRVLHSLFTWAVAFLIIYFGIIIAGNLSRFSRNPKKPYYWFNRFWGRALLWLGRVKVKTEGIQNIPKGRNFIFASNHESALDIIILSAVIPLGVLFAMKKELFKAPLLGKWCRMKGDLPIDRMRPGKAHRDLQNIITRLKQGESAVFFPEGGRSIDGRMDEFKAGIGIIAAGSGVPVIPVAISGSAKIMPRNSFIFYPGQARVVFGKPLYFEPGQSHEAIAQRIRSSIEEMLSQR